MPIVSPLPPVPIIYVTGEAITAAAGNEAFGALVLQPEDLQPASGRVEDALRGIGGLQLFRTASTRTANPTAEGLTARGFAGNASSRIEVTLDGVPLSDPFFGFISWGSLVGQPLSGGELVRGGGVGGPGALAGTLALNSVRDQDHVWLRGGSRNSFEAEGSLFQGVSGGRIGLAGGVSRGDGHLLVRDPGLADVPARYRQWSLAASAEAQIGNLRLDARIAGFADDRLRGVEDADISSSGGDLSLRARIDGHWAADLVAWGKLRDFSTVIRPVAADRSSANTTLDQVKTPASGWGVSFGVEPPLGDDLALRLGAGWRAADGQTEERFRYVAGVPNGFRVAGGRQDVGSLFANGSIRVAPELLLTAAGRVDYWRMGAGRLDEIDLLSGEPSLHAPAAARSGWEGSGRIGAVWRPVPTVQLRLAGYRGWRLPTLNELYRPFRAGANATAANADLDPERLWGAEAGIGWQPFVGTELSATYFWNRLNGSIANVTLGTGPGNFPTVGFVGANGQYRQRQNLGAIRAHGLETEARLPLGPLQLRASAALVNARVEGGALDGLRPAQAPKYSGSLSLGWERDGHAARLSLRHMGARFEDDLNQQKLAASTTLDASLGLGLAPGFRLQMEAENLTDARIETGFSGAQVEIGQPRTLWLGLRWMPGQ